MPQILHSDTDMTTALDRASAADPRLAAVRATAGTFSLRRRDAGFAGLCAIVCGQQLSTSAAATIRDRLFAAFEPFHHDAVRQARSDKLRRLGLSAAKIKSIKAIGAAIADGQIDLDALATMDADKAHAALTALHGIGPWTADVYLLFCLGHADAWPAGDLALQEAARIAFGLRKRPTSDKFVKFAQAWRPYRGAVAHLLWAYYHVVKKRDGAPDAAARNTTKKKTTTKKRKASLKTSRKTPSKASRGVKRKTARGAVGTARRKAARKGRPPGRATS